ncbi:thioredoxin-related transmembrane protein 4 [Podarcis lilfordi]|uniref:Thioredoxin-related transmembrane protein 4 n=1 Tax=Podarcis lilfordi TaxID=74358 RepID=A0AA35K207_9SAUR|nr:thioredoxin-related transmembrane protein 4 [Podarcis lilfordi]
MAAAAFPQSFCFRRSRSGWDGTAGRRAAAAAAAPALVALAAAVAAAVASASQDPGAAAGRPVRELSGSNWSLLLQGQWMVQFYAPWCPACQEMESAWEAFAENSKDHELSVGKVDVTQEPGVSGRFFVTTLPTIYHAKDGVFRRYRGLRTLEDLETYILERKWEAVEPVAGWKSPSSITMHGMAGLFHLSAWIRQIHNYLTVTLGIHVWGSYAVFILATLLIGLILGLILVLLTDCIFPPRSELEDSDLVDRSDDKTEEQQETAEHIAEEPVAEKGLSDGEDEEDESQGNSSEDSAVEGSETENDSEHHASDKVEQSSLRQRKNQVEADGL